MESQRSKLKYLQHQQLSEAHRNSFYIVKSASNTYNLHLKSKQFLKYKLVTCLRNITKHKV